MSGQSGAAEAEATEEAPAAEETLAAAASISTPASDAREQDSSSVSPSPPQLHALFDILTHFETYDEVESFKHPDTIARYGYPFARSPDGPELVPDSSAPLLAVLLRTVVLPLPGVRDLPPDFWSVRLQGILADFARAELSESADKGSPGTRRTLATAASAIHEPVTRGLLGGIPRGARRDLHRAYDRSDARDLVAAWDDCLHEVVYGGLVDELFDHAAGSDDIEGHSPAVAAAADYAIVHLATFLHHVFVLSPEGQYLLRLLENVHKLVPYSMIKQTLRIGNAGTMINGMVRLLLAKMSVTALSNWIGLTQNPDDGMNLLQRIIAMVLAWDSSELRKAADKLEKARGGPSKEFFAAIKSYVETCSRDEHEALRALSAEKGESIVATIFSCTRPDLTLESPSHASTLEHYYTLSLSVRDREQITKVLCRQIPDQFTQCLRDVVAGFEPVIRAVHEAVDIREHLSAAEALLDDFIATSRPKARKEATKAPSVEDYVRLLQRNKKHLYRWLHDVAARCPDVREPFRAWAQHTRRAFEQANTPKKDESGKKEAAAGNLTQALDELFRRLPPPTRAAVVPALDAHAAYLAALQDLSTSRMQRVLDHLAVSAPPPPRILSPSPRPFWFSSSAPSSAPPSAPSSPPLAPALPSSLSSASSSVTDLQLPPPKKSRTPTPASSMCGPGMFLARWQALLDRGRNVVQDEDTKTQLATGSKDGWDSEALARQAARDVPAAPDVDVVVRALGPGFRELLEDMTSRRLPGEEP